jgi:hypothetical protein
MDGIDWKAEQDRFMAVAYPLALRAAQRAVRRWPERKRADGEGEFMAKVWDSWMRLLERGRDPEPLLWPLLYWAKQWIYQDRRLAGRAHNIDIQDYRAKQTQHLLDGRGKLQPHDRAARINGFLDWTGTAKTDDPAELVAALEQVKMTLEEYLAA